LKTFILLIVAFSLLTSCTNLNSASNDANECRKLAYGKNNEPLSDAANNIFSQCQQKKEQLRKRETKEANAELWIDFFSNLFSPKENQQ